ncbi:MAG: hypothetical protein RI973_1941 [Bacteroidota bacterium]|jgi:HD superfamily phosphodiesterase
MPSHIVKSAYDFVTELLDKELSPDYTYHSLSHTLSVRDASLEIAGYYGIDEQELELLELAALFHDTGFTRTYNNHEDASKEIAAAFLEKQQYPRDRIERIFDLIETTRLGAEPQNLLQKILKDADFNTREASYLEKSESLRHEWQVFQGIRMDDETLLKANRKFWEGHRFYTGEAERLYGEEKRKTLKKINKKLEKLSTSEEAIDVNKVAGQIVFAIGKNKSAQMMFKTTLRNQIDLTNIADNKANIMLSINSLLITFGMPLLASQLDKYPSLIWPGSTLLLTCVLSIVNATLATRPVKMGGRTDLSKIDEGLTNLFFFGNFFKMSRDDFMKGLSEVIRREEILDQSIVNDLYFLGRALGQKYYRLRITYSIFMVGMIVTVLVFAITFFTGR